MTEEQADEIMRLADKWAEAADALGYAEGAGESSAHIGLVEAANAFRSYVESLIVKNERFIARLVGGDDV